MLRPAQTAQLDSIDPMVVSQVVRLFFCGRRLLVGAVLPPDGRQDTLLQHRACTHPVTRSNKSASWSTQSAICSTRPLLARRWMHEQLCKSDLTCECCEGCPFLSSSPDAAAGGCARRWCTAVQGCCARGTAPGSPTTKPCWVPTFLRAPWACWPWASAPRSCTSAPPAGSCSQPWCVHSNNLHPGRILKPARRARRIQGTLRMLSVRFSWLVALFCMLPMCALMTECVACNMMYRLYYMDMQLSSEECGGGDNARVLSAQVMDGL